MTTLGDTGPRWSGCGGGLAAQLLPKPPLAGHLPAARHHSQADPTLSAPNQEPDRDVSTRRPSHNPEGEQNEP
jgi:hypothetical protein